GVLSTRVIVLLESRMGCGFGVCQGCAVATRQGVRLVCLHGPAFDLDEVLWEGTLAPTL
ncbi:MAG: dihydroorotate dehydrogenase electron transfer subunit, partial [Chloroflexi bacterium]|nr:dihydroorotate dehydrogenase electron transfer subunit [Chloroflexota bacterium]